MCTAAAGALVARVPSATLATELLDPPVIEVGRWVAWIGIAIALVVAGVGIIRRRFPPS